MRYFHLFLLLAACVAFAATSCNKDSIEETTKPVIKAETAITVPAEGGLVELAVSVENPIEGGTITAASPADWISELIIEDDMLKFNSLNNGTDALRTTTITLSYPEAEDLVITASQDFTDLQGGGSISASMDPISLGPATGDINTLKVAFGGDWYIKSTEDWFTVTPESGEQGSYTLELSVTEANTETEGRTGTMVIASGSNEKQWTIVQLGTKGFYITDKTDVFTSDQKEITINMRANTDEFTFSSDNGMIKSYTVEFSGDYDEIEDTGIYSDYRDAVMKITLNTNPDMDNQRSAEITMSAGTMSQQITIIQPEGRWDTPFYKQSLLLKFTSTGCQFCPFMDDIIEEVMADVPDRLVPVCCYSTALNGTMVWDMTSTLEDYYSINTYPSAVFNSIAYLMHNSGNADIIKDLIDESIASYKAYTTLSATSSTSGDRVKINLSLTSKIKGNFNINAWVLEDGVIKSQVSSSGTIPDYEHNHIGRTSFTGTNGQTVTMDARSTQDITIEGQLSSNIENPDNAYLVLFVTYPGNPTVKGVSRASYKNYNKIVDNAFVLPLNGSIEARYED